jgi:hypothetical protein
MCKLIWKGGCAKFLTCLNGANGIAVCSQDHHYQACFKYSIIAKSNVVIGRYQVASGLGDHGWKAVVKVPSLTETFNWQRTGIW